jgi:hypothetical protein
MLRSDIEVADDDGVKTLDALLRIQEGDNVPECKQTRLAGRIQALCEEASESDKGVRNGSVQTGL